jgi:hypothetical protein
MATSRAARNNCCRFSSDSFAISAGLLPVVSPRSAAL